MTASNVLQLVAGTAIAAVVWMLVTDTLAPKRPLVRPKVP